jgi:poly(beta-D-mannuronate) lyase
VGQIHAKDDEPLRLYYRKLPGNQRGSVYAAHEINGGDDIYYEIVGSRSSSADDPENGIALNELWSYEILAVGNQLTVTIRRGDLSGETLGIAEIDMTESGYSTADEFMYFKAGAYNGNNDSDGGLPNDFSQVTFYHLTATHN